MDQLVVVVVVVVVVAVGVAISHNPEAGNRYGVIGTGDWRFCGSLHHFQCHTS